MWIVVLALALLLAVWSLFAAQKEPEPAVGEQPPSKEAKDDEEGLARTLVQREEETVSATAAAASVVGKLVLPCLSCAADAKLSAKDEETAAKAPIASLLGVESLKVDDVVLVKGGRGAYKAGTPEYQRERKVLPVVEAAGAAAAAQHVNTADSKAVARALARCYRVTSVSGACEPKRASALRFLRIPMAYTESADKKACASSEHGCSSEQCVARTSCPVQVEFDLDPTDAQPYGQGLLSYSTGYPVLAPLNEGKWEPAVWQASGGWRVFYGATHNFSYDYVNRRFYDPYLKTGGSSSGHPYIKKGNRNFKHDLTQNGWASWSFNCKYGGMYDDGTFETSKEKACARGYGRNNENQINNNPNGATTGDYNSIQYQRKTGCKVCNLAKDVIDDRANDRLSATDTKLRVLTPKHFHSMEWAGNTHGGGADVRCTSWHFGKGWRQAYTHHANNKQGAAARQAQFGMVGASPTWLRGAARESVRADEQLTVCNVYKEGTGRAIRERKDKGAVLQVQDWLADTEGGWRYTNDQTSLYRADAPKPKMVVTDADGHLLLKVRRGETFDMDRFPFGVAKHGPARMAPELTWEGSNAGQSTCEAMCALKGKFCVDLHELDDHALATGFVQGEAGTWEAVGSVVRYKTTAWTHELVAKKTMHVRCDEFANQVWSKKADYEKAECLCGNLAAQSVGVALREAPKDTKLTCDEFCATAHDGAKCVNPTELSDASRAAFGGGRNDTGVECKDQTDAKGQSVCTRKGDGLVYIGRTQIDCNARPVGGGGLGDRCRRSCGNCWGAMCHRRAGAGGNGCLCTTGRAPPRPKASLAAARSGNNQWFRTAASGFEYRSRATGACYHLHEDCVGDARTCVTGADAPAKRVPCRAAHSQWLVGNGVNQESRPMGVHPVPHAFGQDPDMLVSHDFWSDITMARTNENPDTSRAGGAFGGGVGGGCGATYFFSGDKSHVYVGAAAGMGSERVGQRALDTRVRYTCPYNYTSRGMDSKASQADLLGSNRKWKAWWGLTVEVDRGKPCYDRMTTRSGWGQHVWAASVGYNKDKTKRICRLYYDTTAAVSTGDGIDLNWRALNEAAPMYKNDDGNLLGSYEEMWPGVKGKGASARYREAPFELALYDERAEYEVGVHWHKVHEGPRAGQELPAALPRRVPHQRPRRPGRAGRPGPRRRRRRRRRGQEHRYLCLRLRQERHPGPARRPARMRRRGA